MNRNSSLLKIGVLCFGILLTSQAHSVTVKNGFSEMCKFKINFNGKLLVSSWLQPKDILEFALPKEISSGDTFEFIAENDFFEIIRSEFKSSEIIEDSVVKLDFLRDGTFVFYLLKDASKHSRY